MHHKEAPIKRLVEDFKKGAAGIEREPNTGRWTADTGEGIYRLGGNIQDWVKYAMSKRREVTG